MNTPLQANTHVPESTTPMKGIALKVLSVVCFIMMAALIKAAGQVPTGQVVFFRSFFAIPLIIIWLMMRGQLAGALSTDKPFSHVLRGITGVIGMALGFTALTRLPLPDATALSYASPLIVVVFSALFLGERVRIYRWSAVLVGLIGVLVISWPKLTVLKQASGLGNETVVGVFAALSAAAVAALAMIQVRRLVKTERTPTIVIYFSLTASVAGLATWFLGWEKLDSQQFALLVLSGILGGLGQIFLTQSYRYADLSVIAPFEYSSILLAIAIGYFAFGEVPTIWTITGALIVVGSGLFIIWREHWLGLENRAARRFQPPQ